MKSKRVKVLIIGSGPTGLGAAYRLKELGESSFLVLEKGMQVGGLSASFVDGKGFTWDIGGHVRFSHYRYFDHLMQKALGKEGWFQHQRESWGWLEGRFVPYPIQNNIGYLTKETMWKCLSGLITTYQQPPQGKPEDFKEWILATFGKGLAEVFMLPYNYKVWAYPPEDMAYQWVGERVAVTDLKRVMNNVLFEKDDLSWGPNHTFQFPKQGGTGAIWKSVAQMVGEEHICLGSEVVEINSEEKEVRLSNGEVIQYEHLISTLPLDLLGKMLRPVLSESLQQACHSLFVFFIKYCRYWFKRPTDRKT